MLPGLGKLKKILFVFASPMKGTSSNPTDARVSKFLSTQNSFNVAKSPDWGGWTRFGRIFEFVE
jgi:hypothetical protein